MNKNSVKEKQISKILKQLNVEIIIKSQEFEFLRLLICCNHRFVSWMNRARNFDIFDISA